MRPTRAEAVLSLLADHFLWTAAALLLFANWVVRHAPWADLLRPGDGGR